MARLVGIGVVGVRGVGHVGRGHEPGRRGEAFRVVQPPGAAEGRDGLLRPVGLAPGFQDEFARIRGEGERIVGAHAFWPETFR